MNTIALSRQEHAPCATSQLREEESLRRNFGIGVRGALQAIADRPVALGEAVERPQHDLAAIVGGVPAGLGAVVVAKGLGGDVNRDQVLWLGHPLASHHATAGGMNVFAEHSAAAIPVKVDGRATVKIERCDGRLASQLAFMRLRRKAQSCLRSATRGPHVHTVKSDSLGLAIVASDRQLSTFVPRTMRSGRAEEQS